VRVLEELETAERALAADDAVPAGRLRIDLPATFGRMRALPLVMDFARRHPQVRPEVSFTDRFVDVVEDGLDVVVRIGGSDSWPAAVGYRHLGHEELVFCAAPGYLAAHGTPEHPEDLLRHDAVLYGRADGSTSPWLIRHDAGPVARQHVAARIVLGQAEAQVAAVEAGLGIAQLATWLVDRQLRDGRLVAVLPHLATQGLPLHVLWQRSRQHAPKVQALIGALAAGLRITPDAPAASAPAARPGSARRENR